jgi:FtsZ-binding cell division protein ZapB
MTFLYKKTEIDELKAEIERLTNLVKYLRDENDHLRDENAKLMIDVAFFDGRMPSQQKGT